MHRVDEVLYTGYRVVVLPSHKHNDSLTHMSGLAQSRSTWDTHLEQKEKCNVSRMEALECDVARPICLVLFPLSSKRHTLRDIANHGWFDFDGLDLN